MTRRFGLGLRAQIVVALSAAFILSFTLLGVAAIQLSGRAQSIERERATEGTARVIAEAIDATTGDRRERVTRLADAAIQAGAASGVEVRWPGIEPHVRGHAGVGFSASAPIADGGVVRVWARSADRAASAPFTNLLILYVSVTGGTILLLTYVALTYLIVRPVAAVTNASERLAAGRHVEVPVRGAAEVARLALAFNDMATQLRDERRALEERVRELEETTEELRAAHDHLERSERLASVGRLAAGVAHEIGNPLAAILGLVELVRAGDLSAEEANEFLRRVQAETERIQKTIRDLLDFSRQGHGEDADGTESADLGEVVEDAVRLVAPQKDLRQVDIERRLDPEAPRVLGSSDRLTQLVLNLLLNAADAIEGEGSIRLEVNPSGDRMVELVVADSGPGVDPEVVGSLFEPFVTTKPVGEGTGLGLAVCHTIVERLGGTIRAENPPEGGARFIVRLPRA